MYRGHMYVPKDPQLCHDIVHAHHDSMMTSHPGQWKTLELVSCNYWWPGISHYVASYVAGCDVCNHCKSFPTQKVGKLTPNQIPTCHWEVISVDTIGELLESKGYNPILVAVDRLSTATRMGLYPLDSSSSPMVSTEITSQWQVGIWFGVSFPTFCVGKDLQWLQTSHPAT